MRPRSLMLTLAALVFMVAACQPAATPVPATATPVPATHTASPVPPTPSASPAPPTATATATAAPTRTATPLPPVPTANFAAADVMGTWVRSDPERGDLYLTFAEDGSYDAAHGSPDGTVHHGDYTLDGRLLTLVDGWNCAPEDATPGQYVLRLLGGGRWLYLDQYNDTCPDRPDALSGFRWDRYVAP